MTPFTVAPQTNTQVFTHETTPVLRVTTEVVQSLWPHPMAGRFDRYYQAQVRAYVHFAQHQLLPLAKERFIQCQETGALFAPHCATLRQVMTYHDGTVMSLYTQTRDTLQPTIIRRGDTWEEQSGFLLPITYFLPRPYKNALADTALRQIKALEQQGFAQFHPQVGKSLLKRRFNPHHYYITPQGLCFFYPMYAIAPAVEQIPTFLYPLEINQGN